MRESNHLIKNSEILYIDHDTSSDQWHSILHSHTFVELFYVVKGSGYMKFSNVEIIEIKEDDLIIVNPNVFHTEFCKEGQHLEYYVIGSEGFIFDNDQKNSRYSIHNFKDYKKEVLTYLQSLEEEERNNDIYRDEIKKSLFEVLLMNILRRSQSKLEVSSVSSSFNKECLFIETYINENSHLNITLDSLAELTYLDKFYLSHLFKEHSGMAPIEYLHNVRIEKAIKLLTTTDFSMTYISSMLGFANAAYFSQFFKKKTGMSPSQYREQYHVSLSSMT